MGLTDSVTEQTTDTPFHLTGNFRPVDREVTAHDLPVVGEIPASLDGLFLRNGPNPKSGRSPHWFLGDGMIHGVRIHNGRAAWYRNRWVRTKPFTDPGARLIADDGTVDLTVGVSNTHVVAHAGSILALVESSFPCRIDAELDTIGPWDFDGGLTTAMTAHPKICPITGELHFFGYGFAPPYLTYHRADARGRLVQSEVIEVPGPTMVHDFSITENHVLFMDLPVVFDLELALAGTMPYRWDDDYGARLGVMPRGAGSDRTRWFDIEPCYVFHPANSFERAGGHIVFDVARYPEFWRRGSDDFTPDANLHRWVIDLETGTVAETQLDDLPIEFPRVPDAAVGRANGRVYGAVLALERSGLVGYDLDTGVTQLLELSDQEAAEPVPVADPEAPDAAGWLLSYVYDRAGDSSELWLVAADAVDAGPVARVTMPQRVPMGFHGSWITDPVAIAQHR